MKLYAVVATGTSGIKEGVLFSDKEDALDALTGECTSGAPLAVEWCKLHGDSESVEMFEVEI